MNASPGSEQKWKTLSLLILSFLLLSKEAQPAVNSISLTIL